MNNKGSLTRALKGFVDKDTNIKHRHEKVRNHADVCSLLLLWFCGGPVQSVQYVLAERGEQAVCHLTTQWGKDKPL